MTTKLSDVKAAQVHWFDKGNKAFFNDIDYRVLHGKVSGNPYLVRSTYAWSGMLGAPRRITWRINPLNANLFILPLIDNGFKTLDDVKGWLKFQ